MTMVLVEKLWHCGEKEWELELIFIANRAIVCNVRLHSSALTLALWTGISLEEYHSQDVDYSFEMPEAMVSLCDSFDDSLPQRRVFPFPRERSEQPRENEEDKQEGQEDKDDPGTG